MQHKATTEKRLRNAIKRLEEKRTEIVNVYTLRRLNLSERLHRLQRSYR